MPDMLANQIAGQWGWDTRNWLPWTWGSRFQVTQNGFITRVGYYRVATGASWPFLGVYNAAGALQWSTNSPTDSGAIGWQWTDVTPNLPVSSGVTYTVAGTVQGPMSVSNDTNTAHRVSPPAPFILDDHFSYIWTLGNPGYPNTVNDSQFFSLSVTFDQFGANGPGPGQGDPTVTGDLNSWLSRLSAANTHQTDGLPWHIGSVVDGLQSVIGAVGDTASATGTLFGKVNKLLQDTATLLARVPATVIQDIHDSFAQFFTWFGGVAKPTGAPTIPQHLSDIDDQLASLANQVSQIGGIVSALQSPLFGFPTDFELLDSFDFAECVAWNQEADVYVLHVTTVPTALAISPMCGVPMIHRAGWWATLADTLPGQRGYIDFEFTALTSPAGRMPGVLIELGQGGAGTVEAWRRLPPPIGP